MGIMYFALGFLCGVAACGFAFFLTRKPTIIEKTQTTYLPQSTDKPQTGVWRDKEFLTNSQE